MSSDVYVSSKTFSRFKQNWLRLISRNKFSWRILTNWDTSKFFVANIFQTTSSKIYTSVNIVLHQVTAQPISHKFYFSLIQRKKFTEGCRSDWALGSFQGPLYELLVGDKIPRLFCPWCSKETLAQYRGENLNGKSLNEHLWESKVCMFWRMLRPTWFDKAKRKLGQINFFLSGAKVFKIRKHNKRKYFESALPSASDFLYRREELAGVSSRVCRSFLTNFTSCVCVLFLFYIWHYKAWHFNTDRRCWNTISIFITKNVSKINLWNYANTPTIEL